jgi:hypothetical protein
MIKGRKEGFQSQPPWVWWSPVVALLLGAISAVMSSQGNLVSEGQMQMKIFTAWTCYGTVWSEFCALWKLSPLTCSKQKCQKDVMVVKWRPVEHSTTSTRDLSALCRTHLELWLYHSPQTTPVTYSLFSVPQSLSSQHHLWYHAAF